ncbi:MAG TPA: hypothetical protein VNU25_01140 [Candidatus Paceibacterota bacterium]|nr:hypothetical protein [Candidatus Paceibacterota bacterium]
MNARSAKKQYVGNVAFAMLGAFVFSWGILGMPWTPNPGTYMARELVWFGSGLFFIVGFLEWYRRYHSDGDQENPFVTTLGAVMLGLCLVLVGAGIYFANTPVLP